MRASSRRQSGTNGPGTSSRHWVELLPLGVVVLVGVPVLLLRPAIVRGTLGSPRALAVTFGVTIAVVGWSAVLRRMDVVPALRSVLVLAPIVVAGLLWIRPYFIDTRVQETLPLAAAGTTPSERASDATPTSSESTMLPSDQAGDPQPEAATAAGTTPRPSERADDAGRPVAATADPTPRPSRPVAVSRGRFVGLDGHRAAGTAAVFRLPDDGLVVRLEDVDLQSVPEAYVHLVPRADATTPGRRSIDLGPLKGNVGSSNYRVPRRADVDPDRSWTVLVWCRPFASPVGAASQRPVR
jgi:hypothetical protein